MHLTDTLLRIFAVLGPIFLLIAAGRILRGTGVIGEAGAADLAKVLYWFALPVQLVVLGASVDVMAHIDVRLILAVLAAYAASFALGWSLTPALEPAARGSALSIAVRANGAFVALPMVELAATQLPSADAAALRAAFAVLLAPSVIMFNIGAVLGFRLPHHGMTRAGLWQAVDEIWRNPLILACLAGLALGAWRPGALAGTMVGAGLNMAAGAAIPLALLLAGFGLSGSGLRDRAGILAIASFGKLVVVPGLTWLAGWALGCPPAAVAAAVFLMAAPTAMASVPMARLLGGDVALAIAGVTATTVAAVVSLAGWLVAMNWWMARGH
jgi:malonate transporter